MCPEGSYSTNPTNPATRIYEMKQMIKALHDAGIGVVMDVVYNHTADNDESNFSLTRPGTITATAQTGLIAMLRAAAMRLRLTANRWVTSS